jgi:hypothetical protein
MRTLAAALGQNAEEASPNATSQFAEAKATD